jgi:hypothetical protein
VHAHVAGSNAGRHMQTLARGGTGRQKRAGQGVTDSDGRQYRRMNTLSVTPIRPPRAPSATARI